MYKILQKNKKLLIEQEAKTIPLVAQTLMHLVNYEKKLNSLISESQKANINALAILPLTFFIGRFSIEYRALWGWGKVREVVTRFVANDALNTNMQMNITESASYIKYMKYLHRTLQEEPPLFEKLFYLYQASLIINMTLSNMTEEAAW